MSCHFLGTGFLALVRTRRSGSPQEIRDTFYEARIKSMRQVKEFLEKDR